MNIENILTETLGVLVGDIIVSENLPTLSTDMIKSRTVIQVSEELSKQWEEKESRYEDKHWLGIWRTEKGNELFKEIGIKSVNKAWGKLISLWSPEIYNSR